MLLFDFQETCKRISSCQKVAFIVLYQLTFKDSFYLTSFSKKKKTFDCVNGHYGALSFDTLSKSTCSLPTFNPLQLYPFGTILSPPFSNDFLTYHRITVQAPPLA